MKVEAFRTPISTPALLRGLVIGFWKLFDVGPSHQCVPLAGAQWAHETGRGDSCFNWNLGNAKATDRWEGDLCERYCTERLTPAQAKAAITRAGQRLDGQGPDAAIVGQKGGKLIVGFWPPNPASRFRAFPSLEVGAVDYLDLLANRFAPAWPELLAGDGERFANKLFEQNYFTDDPAIYGAGLVSLQREFSKHPIDLEAPPPRRARRPAGRAGCVVAVTVVGHAQRGRARPRGALTISAFSFTRGLSSRDNGRRRGWHPRRGDRSRQPVTWLTGPAKAKGTRQDGAAR